MKELINTSPDFAGKFGDKRIDKKATQLLNKLIIGRNSSIRHITSSEAEQRSFYRLLDNESFSEQAIEQSIIERCGALCAGRHLLCIQDTSEFNLNQQRGRIKPGSGIGKTTKAGVMGFILHSSLVIDAENAMPIGYSYIKTWHRELTAANRHLRQYKRQVISNKESNKWIAASEQSKRQLAASKTITIIADRESDIYDLWSGIPDERTHLLLRSNANRRLQQGTTLKEHLQLLPVTHTYSLSITGDYRKNTQTRIVSIAVKWSAINIKKPGSCKDRQLPQSIPLYVIEATETGKVSGICWRLLTTHPVTNATEAMQIISWYKERWHIEQIHRLLKNQGIQIEQSQLEQGYAIRKLTLVAMMAVLRIMQMMLAYEDETEHDAAIAFTEEQQDCLSQINQQVTGTTDKQKNPHHDKTLKWATWIIARLGGWKGYGSQRKAGPIVLQKGLVKFYQMFEGWLMAKQHFKNVYTQ